MIKTVQVGEKEITLKSTAAIPRLYREKMGRDAIVDMNRIFQELEELTKLNEKLRKKAEKEGTEFLPVSEELTPQHIQTLETMTYIMHKYADPTQPDGIMDWLEQFKMGDIYDAFPAVIDIWNEEMRTISKSKKK